MTDDDLKQLVASLAVSNKENSKLIKELSEQMKDTDRRQKETSKQQKLTDKQLKQTDKQLTKQIKALGVQIGGLGNKFGGFTEGMALPSMTRILRERFGMEVISPRVRVRKGSEEMEIDVLAYANSDNNTVVVVEIKSRLLDRDIQQVIRILERFKYFFPEHAGKRLFGLIAAVDVSEAEKQKALKKGLYLAAINDEQFEMQTPPGFQAKHFG